MLAVDARAPREVPTKLGEELERCDREIAAAMKALLTGSAPIVDALLWYTDWCRERELILLAWNETEILRTACDFGPVRATQRRLRQQFAP
jgi:hypothetical protein